MMAERRLNLSVDTKLRVSSVLNGDGKQFGKKFLLDGREDTCWNSDQGSPQFIEIKLDNPVSVRALRIMFQGGFAGKNCILEGKANDADGFEELGRFYPDDINDVQEFRDINHSNRIASVLRIVFPESTDFFGRITVYTLDIIVASE